MFFFSIEWFIIWPIKCFKHVTIAPHVVSPKPKSITVTNDQVKPKIKKLKLSHTWHFSLKDESIDLLTSLSINVSFHSTLYNKKIQLKSYRKRTKAISCQGSIFSSKAIMFFIYISSNLHKPNTNSLCLSTFQAVSGSTTCTALVERRALLSVSPMASVCLTANIQKMSEWRAPRSAFQGSNSSGTRPTTTR